MGRADASNIVMGFKPRINYRGRVVERTVHNAAARIRRYDLSWRAVRIDVIRTILCVIFKDEHRRRSPERSTFPSAGSTTVTLSCSSSATSSVPLPATTQSAVVRCLGKAGRRSTWFAPCRGDDQPSGLIPRRSGATRFLHPAWPLERCCSRCNRRLVLPRLPLHEQLAQKPRIQSFF